MEKAAIFLNPTSGSMSLSKKMRYAESIKKKFEEETRGECHILGFDTKSRKEFQNLLREESKYIDLAIIGGGDGTFGRDALNYISPEKTLAYFPMGSGNALGYALKKYTKNRNCFSHNHRKIISLDVLVDDCGKRGLFFGVGFDGYFLYESQKLREEKNYYGNQAYVESIFKGLFSGDFQGSDMQIKTDLEFIPKIENVFICLVSKHPYVGGGTKILPGAKLDDGLLHGIILNNRKLKIIKDLFCTHFLDCMPKGGFKAKEVKIKTDIPMFAQRDGEYIRKDKEFSVYLESGRKILV